MRMQLREGGPCKGTVASMQENEDTFDLADAKVINVIESCCPHSWTQIRSRLYIFCSTIASMQENEDTLDLADAKVPHTCV